MPSSACGFWKGGKSRNCSASSGVVNIDIPRPWLKDVFVYTQSLLPTLCRISVQTGGKDHGPGFVRLGDAVT